MRSRLLPFFAAAALVYVASSPATACEYEKARSARAATAATAKSCGAKEAKSATAVAANKASCSTQATTAVTASNASACKVGKAIHSAAVASHGSGSAAACTHAKSAGSEADCSEAAMAACIAAGCDYSEAAIAACIEAGCTYSKNTTAAFDKSSCSASKTRAVTAVASAREKLDAAVAGSNCSTSKSALKAGVHGDCEACADWSVCEGELSNVQSTTQVVPLKNGVMYVFTASSPKDVRIVQAVLSGRSDRLQTLIEAGDKATLCAQCKAFRGAVASGNLNREVVNVEGGSLMIMTSPDRELVNQLHLLAGIQSPDHIKG